MPYVTDDDSKAVQRITEIRQQLQEARTDWERWLAAEYTPTSAAELVQREREGKALTDRLGALATALEVQRALASSALHEQERKLAHASPRKMKDFGYRPVAVQFLGGLEVELWARYWCRNRARADKGKGSYFGLTLLGIRLHRSLTVPTMRSIQDSGYARNNQGLQPKSCGGPDPLRLGNLPPM